VTFWYGTYHSGVTSKEGSFHLLGQDVTYDSTVNFTDLVTVKPTGLVDGTTNFYSNGTALTGTNTGQAILAWQGVTFSNLLAGTYTFSYVPIANPTQTWEPWDSIILSSQVTLTAADLGPAPEPAKPTIIDASQGSFNETDAAAGGNRITFGGGVFSPSQSLTLDKPVTLLLEGGTIDTSNGGLSLTAPIEGWGALTKTGAGDLRLTGANTYAGGTTISGGNLIGDSQSLQGAIHNNALLTFDQAQTGEFKGVISGSGGLVKTGAGVLTLSGANTFTGGVTINEGALVVDATSLNTQVLNNAQLIFNQAADGTFAAPISGGGSVIKQGDGALLIKSANSYSGGTILNGGVITLADLQGLGTGAVTANTGTIQTAADGAFAPSLVLPQGQLVIDTDGHTVNASGGVSGAGKLIKTGAGYLNLTGAGGLTGDLEVQEGRLAVNSGLSQAIATVSGGVIGGNGQLGGLIVRTHATAAPGNSIGKLSVASFVVFERGSTYAVEVDAAGHNDRIDVTGKATLEGGVVQVLAENGNYQPISTYRIISAGAGVDGRFEGVTSNLAFLTPVLSYSANAVDLTLTRNDLTFQDVAGTRNQKAVAGVTDSKFRLGSPVYESLIRGSGDEARAAFDQLSGEAHAANAIVGLAEARLGRDAVGERLAGEAHEAGRRGWAQAFGSWGRLGADGEGGAVKRQSAGVMVGGDVINDEGLTVGVAAGYSEASADLDSRRSDSKVKTGHVWAYAAKAAGPLTVRAGVGYAALSFETDRSLALRAYSDRLTASYDGSAIQVFAEVGYGLSRAGLALEPFAAMSVARVKTDGFREAGDALALTGKAAEADDVQTSLGVRTRGAFAGGAGAYRLTAAVRQSFADESSSAALAFISGGPSFDVRSAESDSTVGVLSGAVSWAIRPNLTAEGEYAGAAGWESREHTVRARLNYRF